MCGIAAIFGHGVDAPPVDRDELIAIRDRMIHRGPDGEGLWISQDRRVGLAHRRLTIVDLTDAGSQPMWNRSEEHTSELQSRSDLVCRLLLEKKKKTI